jgi:hypothetical protein
MNYGVHGQVDWATGIPLAIGWGVRLVHALPTRLLRCAFSLFLLLCAVLLGIRA